MPSHPNQFIAIENLNTVTGGAGRERTAQKSQAELRQLAQEHCPSTYQRFRSAPQITRPMAEKCLDEAGYGWAKGRLDAYFPKAR